MKRVFVCTILAGAVCLCIWLKWRSNEPRRTSLKAVEEFAHELNSGDVHVLNRIQIPDGVRDRTSAEQLEFIRKSLQDEFSPEGFAMLKKHATYGPLKQIFPNEADAWTKQAGVNPDDCVAFKLEQNGLSAEVVLVSEGSAFKILRCNNVKQLAATKL